MTEPPVPAAAAARHELPAACAEDALALARVLGSGRPAATHHAVAERVLERIGGLRALSRAGRARLLERAALREGEADVVLAALNLARSLDYRRRHAVSPRRFASAEAVARWAMPRLGPLDREELWVLLVDVKYRLLNARRVFEGGFATVHIHVPSLLREIVAEGAHAFALVHNHPSGDPTPSTDDIVVTDRIVKAAELLEIPLLDHIVVSSRDWRCIPGLPE